ncbi:FlaD/FlaE family flagellar protein [Halobaculum sp. EA56]|uniref:FlaD/FlaE family flagellar protein n=1 Tax=Halobaculum sp. EA56 TaxID=3421648 RepID=UPI003EBDAD15
MGLLTALSGAGVAGVPGADAGLLVSLGLLGASLLDRFRDSDDGPGDAEGDDDLLGGDDGAFGGGGGDDAGGGDDDLGDLGGMDDWDDDDPFAGEDGGGDDGVAELEKRVDDLENEVASLSSTVNTVRSENEEISGKVEDMGEDVRSLLDIYEMVTRGINPFVDDVQGGGDLGGGEGGFGLFDDAGEEEEEEDLDEDLASADAEGFFDEDLAGDEFDDMDDVDDMGELDDDFEEDEEDGLDDDLDGFEDDADDTDSDTMGTDNGGGKSFSELKDEYESGDAEWAGEGDPPEEESDGEDGDALDALDTEPESNGHDAGGDLGLDDEPEPDPEPESTAGPTDPSRRSQGVDDDGGFEFVEEDDLSDEPDKPYLTSLPGDYVGDLMVMEWLEFLVEESTTTDAVRAVNYYERVEWIDEEVADQLKGFLSGFGDIDRNLMDRPGTEHLDLDHHTRSLKYIMQLTDATAESVVIDRWPQLSGGMHGPQR